MGMGILVNTAVDESSSRIRLATQLVESGYPHLGS